MHLKDTFIAFQGILCADVWL